MYSIFRITGNTGSVGRSFSLAAMSHRFPFTEVDAFRPILPPIAVDIAASSIRAPPPEVNGVELKRGRDRKLVSLCGTIHRKF